MEIAIISDTHLSSKQPRARLDNILETGIEKFMFFDGYCKKHNILGVQAGDLFHTPRDWEVLTRLVKIMSTRILTIYGSHDQYYRSKEKGATSLGVLENGDFVKILCDVPYYPQNIAHGEYAFYGAGWNEDIPTPVKDDKVKYNILVTHDNIAEESPYHTSEYMDAKLFLEELPDYDLIICGHIHQKFCHEVDGRIILNSGPMIRREANEYNMTHKPGFWVWEDGEVEWVKIPHKPAKKVLTRDQLEKKKEKDGILNEFLDVFTEKIKDAKIDTDTINVLENLMYFIREENEDIQAFIKERLTKRKFQI